MNPIHSKLQIAHTVYYTIQTPEQNEPWPLLIALHGFGQTAEQFAKIFEPLVEQGVMIAAPQAPHQFYLKLSERKVGFTWLTRYERDRSIADFAQYMNDFYHMLQKEYPIDPTRVFVLGFSQGVSMAYRLWAHSNVPVRGIIACGSDLPPDIREKLGDLFPTPVLLMHGRGDTMVPIAKAHEAFQHLTAYGYPVERFEFDGGHFIPPEALGKIGEMIEGSKTL